MICARSNNLESADGSSNASKRRDRWEKSTTVSNMHNRMSPLSANSPPCTTTLRHIVSELRPKRLVYLACLVFGMLHAGAAGAQTDATLEASVNGVTGLSFSAAEDAGEVPIEVTISLSELRTGDATVTIQTADGFGLMAPALQPDDYMPNLLTFTIPAGDMIATETFNVMVVDDNVVEFDEMFLISIASDDLSLASDLLTITIDDNDVPAFTLELSPSVVFESAGPTPITATVRLDESLSLARAVIISLEITGGTAGPEDYSEASIGALRNPTGAGISNELDQRTSVLTGTITLDPVTDSLSLNEVNETIIFTAAATGDHSSAPVSRATMTIRELMACTPRSSL